MYYTLTQKCILLLLIVGVAFCMQGCDRTSDMLTPPDMPTEMAEVSFTNNILPILTARCAISGCHVENGPEDVDLRSYETMNQGGEHGPLFIPGNAAESEIVEEIVSGEMPLGGPPLEPAQIQLFIDWINAGAIDDTPAAQPPPAVDEETPAADDA